MKWRKGTTGATGWRHVAITRAIHEAEQTILQATVDVALFNSSRSDADQLELFSTLRVESRWAVHRHQLLHDITVKLPDGSVAGHFKWKQPDPHHRRD